ncbi:MAG: carboxypeptidase regulatory-like domain-containing protein [Bacteroidota bacterium]
MKTRLFSVFCLATVLVLSSGSQVFKTSIKITVIDELGNIVEGAAVQLYGTEEDYRNEINPVTDKGITDKKGQIKFKELESKVYFVNVWKDDKNNIGAGVQTAKLEEGKLNKVNIVIE